MGEEALGEAFAAAEALGGRLSRLSRFPRRVWRLGRDLILAGLYPWPYEYYYGPSCGYVHVNYYRNGRIHWRWVYECE